MAYDPEEKCTTCGHARRAHGSPAFGGTQCFEGSNMLSAGCDCRKFTPTLKAVGKDKNAPSRNVS